MWTSFHGGHSAYADGRGTVAQIADAAVQRGFRAFGFSEHFVTPKHNEFSPDGRVVDHGSHWIDDYVTEVQAAKARHAAQLDIFLGIEIEYLRDFQSWTCAALARWPFDYVVGSVHYVRYGDLDICIDWDQARIDEALRRAGSAEQLQLDYYEHVLELLDWHVAVIGHLDLVKMLLSPAEQIPTSGIRSKVQSILETMRDRGVAMDVNARGLIKPCRSIYPADWILAEAQRIGVCVTLGDDSHGPEEVGCRLDQAVTALRRSGFRNMALVRPGGVLDEVPLPEL